jgi:formylglycine-generating enzyme required for sulfatase activity
VKKVTGTKYGYLDKKYKAASCLSILLGCCHLLSLIAVLGGIWQNDGAAVFLFRGQNCVKHLGKTLSTLGENEMLGKTMVSGLMVTMLGWVVTAQADVFHMPIGQQSMELVTVGSLGNAPDMRLNQDDTTGYGAVPYLYSIGKYEVTAAQYTVFLNAVAATDTYGLYNTAMATRISVPRNVEDANTIGCGIVRSGISGNYVYSVAPDYANRPVTWVSWGDSIRFVNWLSNGQPAGLQSLNTTEDGSYYLNGATMYTDLQHVTRKANATYVIPTEDEWYKAAYHKNDGATGHYWTYATCSDTVTGRDMSESTKPTNNANYGIADQYGIIPIDSNTYYTTAVGQFSLSKSPYGTFDQSGNAQEWNETLTGSVDRGTRGGSFHWIPEYQAAWYRDYNVPVIEDSLLGFRVGSVPVPEPSSIAMLLGIAMMTLLYRCHNRMT